MNLATFKLMMAIGVLLNSALYLISVIAAGLVTHNHAAWWLGIAAAGTTYLSYVCHFAAAEGDRTAETCQALAAPLVWFSIALGAAAGLWLL